MIEAPKPGLYRNIAPEVYHAWDAVSASLLADLRRYAPAQVRYNQLHPRPETPAKAFGNLLHTAILEPETLEKRYVVSPRFNRTFKDASTAGPKGYDGGKLEAEAFERQVASLGKVVMEAADFERVRRMRDAAWADRQVRRLLEAPERMTEVSAVWIDPVHGLPCKMRIDLLLPWLCTDLKSAVDVSPVAFGRTIENFAYHVKAAHYLRGLKILHETDFPYAWIVQDKDEPHLCAVYHLDPEDLAEGEEDRARLTALLAHCKENDTWPGYTLEGQAEVCTRPRWARRSSHADADNAAADYNEETW